MQRISHGHDCEAMRIQGMKKKMTSAEHLLCFWSSTGYLLHLTYTAIRWWYILVCYSHFTSWKQGVNNFHVSEAEFEPGSASEACALFTVLGSEGS